MTDIKLISYTDSFWRPFENSSNVFKTIKNYIDHYPTPGSIFILVEENYIDKDFIIDYSNYYARCFDEIPKKTIRYHFFTAGKKEDILGQFHSIFTNVDLEESLAQLNRGYLGFLVKKELKNGCIGRTILRKYPHRSKQNGERVLNVSCTNRINVFGIPLELETLPFQEQDGGVAACATMAIWSALRALGKKFSASIPYAPSEITDLAFKENSLVSSPKFPNEGLNIHQIIGVFAKLGYNIIPYSNIEDNEFLSRLFRANLDYGIPLIGLLEFDGGAGKTDYHAVTISGYKMDPASGEIIGLFVHDDQIGPYSKVNFRPGKLWEWQYDWFDKRKSLRKITLTEVLVPLYPKIRLTFTAIYEEAYLYLKNKHRLKNSDMEIHLYDINSYKWELITKILPVIENKEKATSVLTKPFPKYLWVLRLKANNIPSTDFLFDATTHNLSLYDSIDFY